MDNVIKIDGLCPLLQVYDMPEALKFYCDVLGFTVIASSKEGSYDADWIWLKLDNTEIMLNTAYEKEHRPETKDKARQAAHSDTSIYFGCADIDTLYQYLLSKNIDVKPPVKTGYNYMALNVFDPDGYQLVFHWPLENEV